MPGMQAIWVGLGGRGTLLLVGRVAQWWLQGWNGCGGRDVLAEVAVATVALGL